MDKDEDKNKSNNMIFDSINWLDNYNDKNFENVLDD